MKNKNSTAGLIRKKTESLLGQKVTPLAESRCLCAGRQGSLSIFSVLMNVMPAKVAGVDEIIMTTPPGKDGKVYPSTLGCRKRSRCRSASIKSVVHRQSQHLHLEPKASRK